VGAATPQETAATTRETAATSREIAATLQEMAATPLEIAIPVRVARALTGNSAATVQIGAA
jgi:hypothetical protein